MAGGILGSEDMFLLFFPLIPDHKVHVKVSLGQLSSEDWRQENRGIPPYFLVVSGENAVMCENMFSAELV